LITSFQLWSASPPDPLTMGSAHGPRWGLRPQTSVIGSPSTLAVRRLAKFLNPPLLMVSKQWNVVDVDEL